MADTFKVIEQRLTDRETGEEVPGVTVIVDGKLRQVFDAIIAASGFESYQQIVGAALTDGISGIIQKISGGPSDSEQA